MNVILNVIISHIIINSTVKRYYQAQHVTSLQYWENVNGFVQSWEFSETNLCQWKNSTPVMIQEKENEARRYMNQSPDQSNYGKFFSQANARSKFWRQNIVNLIEFSPITGNVLFYMRKLQFESSKLEKFYVRFIILTINNTRLQILFSLILK